MTSYAQLTILGGLPVEIEYEWDDGDRSVGLSPGIASWSIISIAERDCKKEPHFLYERIKRTKGEEDRIVNALYDHHQG